MARAGQQQKKRMRRPEQDFQASLVRTLGIALTRETTFFHIPNGGARSKIEAAIFKGLGVMPGLPDLVFINEGRIFGMELKAPNGRISNSQHAANVALTRAGMPPVAVIRDTQQALAQLRIWGLPTRILGAN